MCNHIVFFCFELHFIITIFLPEKIHGGSKITKINYTICLVVNFTLAGRHQQNHQAAKPN